MGIVWKEGALQTFFFLLLHSSSWFFLSTSVHTRDVKEHLYTIQRTQTHLLSSSSFPFCRRQFSSFSPSSAPPTRKGVDVSTITFLGAFPTSSDTDHRFLPLPWLRIECTNRCDATPTQLTQSALNSKGGGGGVHY